MAAGRPDFVKEITPAKESWDIVVRAINVWFVPDMNSKQFFFAMEMVLMDEKGDKIQASVRKALLSQFENKIREGFVYNLKSFGVAANTGAFRTTKHQFKLNLQNGTMVTEVGTGLITVSPYSFASFPEIVGKIDMDYLIDVWELFLGLDVKGSMKGILYEGCFRVELEEEFLNLSQRKTIEELKDCQNSMVCVVLGTIKHVIGGNDWWYAACVCNKGVVADSKRYRIKLRVIDETDSATFVTRKTCSDLIEEMDRDLEPAIVPRVIGGFVEQTLLFKIDVKNDVNSGFEQSFRVKKVCADKDIITRFKSVVKNSAGVEDDLAAGVVQSDLPADSAGVVQDLNSKFETIVAEEKCEDNGSVAKPIEVDVADCTPIKRGLAEVADKNDRANSRILENHKD